MNDLCDEKTRKKCNSFYKEAFLNRSEYIRQLKYENKDLQQRIDKLITNWREFENYINNNKPILNNPAVLDFYLI